MAQRTVDGRLVDGPEQDYLTSGEVAEYLRMTCPAEVSRLVKRGEFPQPIRLSRGNRVWWWRDIVSWIESKRRQQFGERDPGLGTAAQHQVPETSGATPPAPPMERGGRGRNIDALMLQILIEDPSSSGWSAREWAARLGCSDGTVKATKTWKERIKRVRAVEAAAAAERMDGSDTTPRGRRVTKFHPG